MRGDRLRALGQPASGADTRYLDWEAIYADNVGRIYRLMFAKVGNRPDAEDLTSQVFLTAYGPLRATASVGEVRAYLTATARTVLADHWRRTLGHQITHVDPEDFDLHITGRGGVPDELSDADGNPAADERAARILRGLPERQRRILALRFLHGYTIRQAAAQLGVTVANAKVLQHRALRAAAGLEKEGKEGDVR